MSIPQPGKVYAVVYAPAGGLLAIAGQNSLELHSVDTNSVKHSLVSDGLAITAVAFSRDGKIVAGSDVSGRVTLWDAVTGAVKAVITEHTDLVDSLSFSPDGKILAMGGYDNTVMLLNTESNSLISKFTEADKITSLSFSHNGSMLAFGGWSKSVQLRSR